jgi:hypothetical protein
MLYLVEITRDCGIKYRNKKLLVSPRTPLITTAITIKIYKK